MNELDIAMVPGESRPCLDLVATRDAAVQVFSDWENNVKAGEPVAPGTTLQRLHLDGGHADFPVKITGGRPLHALHGPRCGRRIFMRPTTRSCGMCTTRPFTTSTATTRTSPPSASPCRGDVDGKRLNDWIGAPARKKGPGYFPLQRRPWRYAVSDKRLVFQAVHMTFDATFDQPWGGAPRTNIFVFIGRNLNREELVGGFKSCLVAN